MNESTSLTPIAQRERRKARQRESVDQRVKRILAKSLAQDMMSEDQERVRATVHESVTGNLDTRDLCRVFARIFSTSVEDS